MGWWEIVVPTRQNITNLCTALTEKQIAICVVTGIPSGVVADLLDGRLGYCLITPPSYEIATVTILVATPWGPHVRLHEELHGKERRLAACSGMDGTLIVGIYAPHVGRMDTGDHAQWLIKAITMIEETATQNNLHKIWICGDLNIRGLFPGDGAGPAQGSSHSILTRMLKSILEQYNLRPIRTVTTHNKGGALDGHITNMMGNFQTKVEKIRGVNSDHLLTHVATHIRMPPRKDRTAPRQQMK